MGYCLASDVAAIVQAQPFTDVAPVTTPSLTQVNNWITQISDEMDISLNGAGYVVPVAAAGAYPATKSLSLLKTVCSLGVAAFATQDAPNSESAKTGADYRAEFESMLNDILTGATKLFDALPTKLLADYPYQEIASGNLEPETDGSAREAIFSRGLSF